MMDITKLGPYLIQREIGRGGMGTVYEAKHEASSDVVALKSLITSRSSDARFRRRFEAEIITLLHLDHPNIVRILGHGQDQGHLFFAMQLVDGTSLHDLLKKRGPLPWAEVVGYTLDICEGLRHAHDRGFIHRDLKPGNLLLDKQGRVLITDFGIARDSAVMREDRRDQITSPGGVVGTLDFMAPEQLHGETATVRSDLYSLGCVMYALLAGRTPFSFKNIGDAQTTIMNTSPTRIGLLVPQLPSGLERIIMRMLEIDPAKRHGSALAVVKRLNEFLEERALQPSDSDLEGDDEHESDDFKLQDEVAVHSQKTVMSGQNESDPTAMSTQQQEQRTDSSKSNEATNRFQPTVASHADAWGASPKPDYFSPVTDEESKQRSWDLPESSSGPVWPYVVGLSLVLVCLLGGLYWVVVRQPTADQLYEQISVAIQDSQNPAEVEAEITRFLKQFPDDERYAEVEQYRLELEARRLPRKLNRTLQFRGTGNLIDVEREFLAILRVSETQPSSALAQMAALVDVYQDQPGHRTEQCVAAARQQIIWLETIVAEQRAEREKLIDDTLHLVNGDTALTEAEVRDRCRSLILLFGDDPSLGSALEPVRQRLAAAEKAAPE